MVDLGTGPEYQNRFGRWDLVLPYNVKSAEDALIQPTVLVLVTPVNAALIPVHLKPLRRLISLLIPECVASWRFLKPWAKVANARLRLAKAPERSTRRAFLLGL